MISKEETKISYLVWLDEDQIQDLPYEQFATEAELRERFGAAAPSPKVFTAPQELVYGRYRILEIGDDSKPCHSVGDFVEHNAGRGAYNISVIGGHNEYFVDCDNHSTRSAGTLGTCVKRLELIEAY